MKLTDSLHQLLREHEYQARHPEIWQDNPWKGTYYSLLNRVHDSLEAYPLLVDCAKELSLIIKTFNNMLAHRQPDNEIVGVLDGLLDCADAKLEKLPAALNLEIRHGAHMTAS